MPPPPWALLGACEPQTGGNQPRTAGDEPPVEVVTVVPDYLRPPVMGRSGGVAAGHPLTTAAAIEILQDGGNAFDAGVAALLTGGVVEPDLYSLGGESLILVYPMSEGKVTSIVGQGWAPREATIDWYRERGRTLYGYGLDPAVVPGALHGALTVLERWGTMSFEAVGPPAPSSTRKPASRCVRAPSTRSAANSSSSVDGPATAKPGPRPDGSLYESGEIIRLPALANTLRKMVEAEREHRAAGREGRHRRGARPLLQGRHCRGNGRVPAGQRRPVRAR